MKDEYDDIIDLPHHVSKNRRQMPMEKRAAQFRPFTPLRGYNEALEKVLNAHNKSEHKPAHTAEHLLNQTMVRMFGCERSRDAHIERKKSKVNYRLDKCPTVEQIAAIERRMNELIAADLPVTYEYVTRDNIPHGVKLDKLPENASLTIRLVRIGDYDICPCIGEHVKSTGELEEFRITSTSYKDGVFRIVYRVVM